MKLTKNDKIILESYKQTVYGLSKYLGNAYELVLHSLEDLDHSVILIINGHHTGRKEGSPITDLALSMLDKIQENNNLDDMGITYFATNKHGDLMRSSTIAVKGENDRIIALLCINFYMNTPFSTILETYNTVPEQGKTPENEKFMNSSEALIRESIGAVTEDVMMEQQISASNKNKEIVYRLYKEGLFKLKVSVPIVAEMLNISKNTVYMHLRNFKAKDKE